MIDEDDCTCDSGEWDEHTCPFRADVNDDSESLCTCCPMCEANCADDI